MFVAGTRFRCKYHPTVASLIVLLLSSPICAQVLPLSVAVQGSEAFPFLFNRRVPRNLALIKTTTCNPSNTVVHVPAALIDQRIEATGVPVLARAVVLGYI